MDLEAKVSDEVRGMLPGHVFRVLRGPYVGYVGQWAGLMAFRVIALTWPELGVSFIGPNHIQFRLDDLEDITEELV